MDVLVATRAFQILTEKAAQRTHGIMQGLTGVVHDGCQLCQHPPLAYRLHSPEDMPGQS